MSKLGDFERPAQFSVVVLFEEELRAARRALGCVESAVMRDAGDETVSDAIQAAVEQAIRACLVALEHVDESTPVVVTQLSRCEPSKAQA